MTKWKDLKLKQQMMMEEAIASAELAGASTTTPNNKEEKCTNGECRACHDGINEQNPTGQRAKCPFISPTPDSITCDCKNTFEGVCYHKISPTPTDSWEEEFEKKWNHDIQIPGVWNSPLKTPRTVGRGKIHYDLFDENKIKKYIKDLLSQVRQKAKEEVLRDIIVMETPTRGIEGETVMEYASSLGIDLSDNK